MSKIIGIIGTRQRDSQKDFEMVREAFLDIYEEGDAICSGLCPQGGDRFAVILADEYKTQTIWFPAEWDIFGKSAGFKRNTDIAKRSDVLIACVADDRRGGTEDTIRKFRKFKGDEGIIVVGTQKGG